MVPLTEERPWGSFTVLFEAPGIKTKQITVKAGNKISLQSHLHRSEDWYVYSGGLFKMTLGPDLNNVITRNYITPCTITVPKTYVHRIEALSTDVSFIEIQTGSYLEEDDIMRYEDDYDRL